MVVGYLSWVLYILGFILVVCQWIGLVSFEVGMAGWVMGLIGWGMGYLPSQRRRRISYEIERLNDQRQKGLITDEEFESLKAQLIGHQNEKDAV